MLIWWIGETTNKQGSFINTAISPQNIKCEDGLLTLFSNAKAFLNKWNIFLLSPHGVNRFQLTCHLCCKVSPLLTHHHCQLMSCAADLFLCFSWTTFLQSELPRSRNTEEASLENRSKFSCSCVSLPSQTFVTHHTAGISSWQHQN